MRSFNILSKRFLFPKNSELPQILVVCGPCRSGTTAFSNNLVILNVESHMQPMKSILRERADDVSTIPEEILFRDPECILIKETFGAQDKVELFNPVRFLVEAGYPADRIKVVGMVREPVATFDSWLRLWGTEVNEDIFLEAYLLMAELQNYCQQCGVTYLPYVPELIRDNNPAVVLQRTMLYLTLPFDTHGMCQWNGKPQFGDNKNSWPNLHFYDAPPPRFLEGVRNWGGYVYRHTTVEKHEVPEATRVVYDDHRRRCEEIISLRV